MFRKVHPVDHKRKNISVDMDLYNKLKKIKKEIKEMGILISYSNILRFIFDHVDFEKIEQLLYADCRKFLGE